MSLSKESFTKNRRKRVNKEKSLSPDLSILRVDRGKREKVTLCTDGRISLTYERQTRKYDTLNASVIKGETFSLLSSFLQDFKHSHHQM